MSTRKSSSIAVPKAPQPRRALHPDDEMAASPSGYRLRNEKRTRRLSNNANTKHDDGESTSESSDENQKEKIWTYADCNHKLQTDFKQSSLEQRNHLARYSPPLARTECHDKAQKKKVAIHSPFVYVLGVVGCLIAAIATYCYFYNSDTSQPPIVDLRVEIQTIQHNFPSQVKEMWPDIVSGINSVLLPNSTVPSMFLFLHNENEATSSCLARRVAHVASSLMNASQRGPLFLNGDDLAANTAYREDRGRLIQDYKPLVEAHRIVVINNLEAVPADLARSLHIFCDQVTPLVGRAIYIFTLNAHEPWDGSNTKMAERCLNAAWKQLHVDVRQPLIVRVTGGTVVRVQPEGDAHGCN